MRQPQMILFDAGETLINYLAFDTLKGTEAAMPYLVKNPKNLSAKEIDDCMNRVTENFLPGRKLGFEVSELTILRLVSDLLGLEYSVPDEQVERVIWENTPVIQPVPHVDELLGALNAAGIRTGVISNFELSGCLLREKLDELFPENRFEFVLVSSDYGLRKPQPLLFRAGLAKSGLDPEEVWYVGDKLRPDVEGSRACGMTPVLYRNPRQHYGDLPAELLTVGDYRELLLLLGL
ncbi:MAG: HAD-IA family hydrolase [Oscillospiraceae bacterium]|nr:HAD-IA family hydrolase [Oscillospiraceae bacterium]